MQIVGAGYLGAWTDNFGHSVCISPHFEEWTALVRELSHFFIGSVRVEEPQDPRVTVHDGQVEGRELAHVGHHAVGVAVHKLLRDTVVPGGRRNVQRSVRLQVSKVDTDPLLQERTHQLDGVRGRRFPQDSAGTSRIGTQHVLVLELRRGDVADSVGARNAAQASGLCDSAVSWR
eukprot:6214546-Pleurochrysis_carterae.AAC.6